MLNASLTNPKLINNGPIDTAEVSDDAVRRALLVASSRQSCEAVFVEACMVSIVTVCASVLVTLLVLLHYCIY